MSMIEAVSLIVAAVAAAICFERIIAHVCRRASEEAKRLELAAESLKDQRERMDSLLGRATVPHNLRAFIVDIAEILTERKAAHVLLRLIKDGRSPNERSTDKSNEYVELCNSIDKLRTVDIEAYEIYRTFIFSSPIAALLQWPETSKAMAQLSLRLAKEREPDAARDLVVMKHAVTA